MRATSPKTVTRHLGEVGWSNELGHGLRAPEPKQHSPMLRTKTSPRPEPTRPQGTHAEGVSSERAAPTGPTSSEPASQTVSDVERAASGRETISASETT
jgi:hypothetical protein